MTCVVHNKPVNKKREKIMTCVVHNKPVNKKMRKNHDLCSTQ